jgi:hypothetical protein
MNADRRQAGERLGVRRRARLNRPSRPAGLGDPAIAEVL